MSVLHIFVVVSDLVKKKHTFRDVPLTVIPYYHDFDELSLYSGDYFVDPLIIQHIMETQEIDKKFDFESVKFDEQASRFYFTKQFNDPKDATEFKNKLKDFLQSFVKELKIPETVFEEVKGEIESNRNKFEADKVKFQFDGFQVTLVGKKKEVALKKRSIEAVIDMISEDAVKTIYVSGLKDSTTKDTITIFFENEKRTGGGELCGRKEGFKRLSPTVARLKFVSSKGIVNSVSVIIMQSAIDHIYTCKIKLRKRGVNNDNHNYLLGNLFLIPSRYLILCVILDHRVSLMFSYVNSICHFFYVINVQRILLRLFFYLSICIFRCQKCARESERNAASA